MKPLQDYEKDLASIRAAMDRSSKFISLSGLSGVLAGVYALLGAFAAYFVIQYPYSPLQYKLISVNETDTLIKLIGIALLVLSVSVATGLWFSNVKAKRNGSSLWGPATRALIFNLSIPLATGGAFVLILLFTGHFALAAPACLVFYGLALIQASTNTFDEVRYLGYSEIGLGLISAALPGYGLLFWAIGFGVLHIVYGALMYKRYDR